MRFETSERFEKSIRKLPVGVRKKFYKQVSLLLGNPKHPSLHTKKIKGADNIWEVRVDDHYRFTFSQDEDLITLRVIGHHDDVLKKP